MNLKIDDVSSLSPAEIRQCYSLSFREDGNMYYDLYAYYTGLHRGTKVKFRPSSKKPAKVIRFMEDGKLIAWCLMTPEKPRGRYVAQFYTRASYRGRGLGTKLMQEALKIDPKPWVYPHDQRAAGLFKKHKSMIRYDKKDPDYRKEMK